MNCSKKPDSNSLLWNKQRKAIFNRATVLSTDIVGKEVVTTKQNVVLRTDDFLR
jgi:hypothetical protein